jgi:NodT family efflux transporter outer membrane factor (OMF) lipoprotein
MSTTFFPGALRASAAACVLLLAGCAHGPDFQRPEPPAAERYTAEKLGIESSSTAAAGDQRVVAGAAVDPEWWKQFHSPALDELVRQALAGNQTLTAAVANLAQAQDLADAQQGRLAPQVGLTAGIGRQKYGAEFLGTSPKPPTFTYFAVGPTVSYSVDYAGVGSRSVEQQRALAEVRQRQLEAAGLAVAGQAVLQALRIASLRAQIATIDTLTGRDRENLKLVQEALDAGSVSRLDLVSAQSQLAADATLLPPLRQELSAARHTLAVLMGRTPADAALPDFDLAQLSLPAELPLSVPSELARRRPDILAAEAQLHAATAAVGVAEGNLYPHLDLSASTGQQAVVVGQLLDKGSNVFGLAASLVAPIFDGGTLRAQKRAAVDALQSNAAHYKQTVLDAFGQVADSLQALDHGAEALRAQATAQQAAQDTVDLTRQSYHEGNTGVLQVLDAERRYQQARLGYVKAEAQRYADTVQLFLALGGAVPRG